MRGFHTAGKMLTGTRQWELCWGLAGVWLYHGWAAGCSGCVFIQAQDQATFWSWCSFVVSWRDRCGGGVTLQVVGECNLEKPGALSYLWEVVVFFLLFLFQHCALSAAAHIDLRGCWASCRRDNKQGPTWRWQGQGGTHLPWKLHFAWDYFQQDVAPTSHLCHHGTETS